MGLFMELLNDREANQAKADPSPELAPFEPEFDLSEVVATRQASQVESPSAGSAIEEAVLEPAGRKHQDAFAFDRETAAAQLSADEESLSSLPPLHALPEHERFGARTLFASSKPAKRHHRWDRALSIALALAAGALMGGYLHADREAPQASYDPPSVTPPAESLPLPSVNEAKAQSIDSKPVPMVPPPATTERPVDRDRSQLYAEMEMAEPEESSASKIKVTRRAITPRSDLLIDTAFAAYREGNVGEAHAAYWRALRMDPANRNALLGLAAMAANAGEQAQARELYLRLLDRDPNDPLALAGLLNLEPPTEIRAQESRIKLLLRRYADAAYLHAALGNLFASEQRWPEAYTAYAHAHALDERDSLSPEHKNPTFAFNLAVSLEHLGRNAEALSHYRAALAHAAWRKPDFDPALAKTRLQALQAHMGE